MKLKVRPIIKIDAPTIVQRYYESVSEGLTKVTEAAADEAQNEAPVKTGALRDSIYGRLELENKSGYIGSPLHYARHQEFGTRYHAPQSYFRPALDKILNKIKDYFNG